jgi:hypothetical protein
VNNHTLATWRVRLIARGYLPRRRTSATATAHLDADGIFIVCPDDATTEAIFHYMIRTGSELRIEQDRHVKGLFPPQTWFDLMQEAGFCAEK